MASITEKPQAPTGDWNCTHCGNMNFARRFACNSCFMPMPGVAPDYEAQMIQNGTAGKGRGKGKGKGYGMGFGKGMGKGMWGASPWDPWGSFGGYGGFGGAYGGAYGGYGGFDADPFGMGLKKVGPPPMPGDWKCTKCYNINFARRTECNQCGVARAGNEEDVGASGILAAGWSLHGKVMAGDWTCPACSNHNFARRIACHRCQTPKPEGAAPVVEAPY
eukprot:EG_transcript_20105